MKFLGIKENVSPSGIINPNSMIRGRYKFREHVRQCGETHAQEGWKRKGGKENENARNHNVVSVMSA